MEFSKKQLEKFKELLKKELLKEELVGNEIKNYKLGKVAEKFVNKSYYNNLHHLIGPVGSGKDVATLLKLIVNTQRKGKDCKYARISLFKDNNFEPSLRSVNFLGVDSFSNEGFYFNGVLSINNVNLNFERYKTTVYSILLNDLMNKKYDFSDFSGFIIEGAEDFSAEELKNILSKLESNRYHNPFYEFDWLLLSNGYKKPNFTRGVICEYQPDGDSPYAENLENLTPNYYESILKYMPKDLVNKIVRTNYSKYE